MARHRWSLLCHRGVVDKYSNLLSVLEVIDELAIVEPIETGAGDAAVRLGLHLVSFWVRNQDEAPEKFYLQVTAEGPQGEALGADVMMSADLAGTIRRTRLIMGIPAVKFAGLGVYRFHVAHGPTETGPFSRVETVPLELKSSPVPAPAS